MKLFYIFIFVLFSFWSYSQNVGIGTATPEGTLHIKGISDSTQLVIDWGAVQNNIPIIKVRSNTGADVFQVRSAFGIYIGNNSGKKVYNSFGNTALGNNALMNNEQGGYNTALGLDALQSNINGTYNIAIGTLALKNNLNGSENTSMGDGAMFTNYSGSENTAIGRQAMYSNYSSSFNTAVGKDALKLISTGANYNVAVGHSALYYNTVGVRNIAVGAGAGTHPSGNFGNTISIGNHNYLNAAYNQAFFGNLNIVWNGGNVPWSTYSDARIKTNIKEDVKGLPFIMRLRPVTYYRNHKAALEITKNKDDFEYQEKNNIEKIKFSGFLAQEVEEAALKSGYSFQGVQVPTNKQQLYTLSYESFVVPIVKAIQEQQQLIENLQKENAAIKNALEQLKSELTAVLKQ